MNLALFAGGDVGYEIARFLGERGEPPACVVIDDRDSTGYASRITHASGVPFDKTVRSSILYEDATLRFLRELRLDLAVLAWWPYILKRPLLQVARLGFLNFHPSLLPYDRGKHYNFWTLVEDTPFGVSIHFVDEGVDTGDIAFQSALEKSWEDTGKTLYERAKRELVRLFIENYPHILAERIPRIPQGRSRGSYHREHEMDQVCRIDLDHSYRARELLNLLRARTFPSHPACHFHSDGEKYEVRVEIRRVSDNP